MTPTSEYLIISADEAQIALRAHLVTKRTTCERHEDGACTYRWNDGAQITLRVYFDPINGSTDVNFTHEGRELRTLSARVDRYLTPDGVLTLVYTALGASHFATASCFEHLLARS